MKTVLLLTAVLMGALHTPATAADFTSTWNGSISQSWNVGGKWTTPGAPGTGRRSAFPTNPAAGAAALKP